MGEAPRSPATTMSRQSLCMRFSAYCSCLKDMRYPRLCTLGSLATLVALTVLAAQLQNKLARRPIVPGGEVVRLRFAQGIAELADTGKLLVGDQALLMVAPAGRS